MTSAGRSGVLPKLGSPEATEVKLGASEEEKRGEDEEEEETVGGAHG